MIYQGETLTVSYLEDGIAELRFDARVQSTSWIALPCSP